MVFWQEMLPIQTLFDEHLADEEPIPSKFLLQRFVEPGTYAAEVILNSNFQRILDSDLRKWLFPRSNAKLYVRD
jgi:hypothetical protein